MMDYNPKIHYIPARPKPIKRVGIYCRVSSSKDEQLKSLSNQISGLTRKVANIPSWRIMDMYVEIQSAKVKTTRSELSRLIKDCQSDKLDIVVLRDVSRLGRDTVETLESYRAIRNSGVRVIFDENGLDTDQDSNEFILSVLEAVYQAENESRSHNIKMGNKQRAMDGNSGLYNRKCYGYTHSKKGELIPHPVQVKIVQRIFDWYLDGESVIGIVKLLEDQQIPSPRGKDIWPKRTIDTMLSNEKYMGDVILEIEVEPGKFVMIENNHLGIISREKFNAVQEEKARRSNVVQHNGKVERVKKRYSSKK